MDFMFSMSKGTLVQELTLAKEFPIPTHLSLVLDLVRLYKFVSFKIRIEMLLRLF